MMKFLLCLVLAVNNVLGAAPAACSDAEKAQLTQFQSDIKKLTTEVNNLNSRIEILEAKCGPYVGDTEKPKEGKKASPKKDKDKQKKSRAIIELSDNDFVQFVKDSESPSFVLLHAPWCGHCKKLMPDFVKIANTLADKAINIIKVDADSNRQIATKFKVKGFPTLIMIPKGGNKPFTYQGGRDYESMLTFLKPYSKESGNQQTKAERKAEKASKKATKAEKTAADAKIEADKGAFKAKEAEEEAKNKAAKAEKAEAKATKKRNKASIAADNMEAERKAADGKGGSNDGDDVEPSNNENTNQRTRKSLEILEFPSSENAGGVYRLVEEDGDTLAMIGSTADGYHDHKSVSHSMVGVGEDEETMAKRREEMLKESILGQVYPEDEGHMQAHLDAHLHALEAHESYIQGQHTLHGSQNATKGYLVSDSDELNEELDDGMKVRRKYLKVPVSFMGSQKTFYDNCDKAVCVITLLPVADLDTANEALHVLENTIQGVTLNAKFFFSWGGVNKKLEEMLGLHNYPSSIVINQANYEFAIHLGGLDELPKFCEDVADRHIAMGRLPSDLPEIQTISREPQVYMKDSGKSRPKDEL